MKNHKEQFPIIRFHIYCDEWKQHKLGEVFEQTVEYVDPYEQNLELWSVTVESGLTPKEERYNREFLVKKSDKFKKLYPEEIVYNPMNITIGAVGFNNIGKEVAVSGYYVTMKIKSKFSNKFFSAWLSCPKAIKLYKIYSTGSLIERQRVQFPTLSDINDYFPTFEEQSAIGSLFLALDDLLASYKNNLANYQSLRGTMLSKMFPKAGQTVPEIRFDGFEGEWVEKRLKDISKRVTRKNNGLVSERALTISAQFGLVDQEEFFQKKVASKDVSGYYLIKNGEFAYNKSYSTGYPLGAIKRLDKYEHGVLSTLYILFKAVDVDSDYLAHYYESDKWHREVSMCAAEGARNHGLLNIAPVDFFNTRLVIPEEREEQQAIGAYFSNLDNLISSHQEKISQLETLKKKLLQDMFI